MYYEPYLLANKPCLSNIAVILPLPQKQLAQEWVQRFLLAAQLLAAAAILLMEGAEEPFQHKEGPFLGIGLFGRSNKDLWVFGPVSGVFDEGRRGEDEGGSGQGGQIAVKRSD